MGGTSKILIWDIPVNFGSADLRSFFSEFVESDSFHIFHYKRRPFDRIPASAKRCLPSSQVTPAPDSRCALIKMRDKGTKESSSMGISLKSRFDGQPWVGRNQVELTSLCRVHLLEDDLDGEEDMKACAEFHPPTLAPQGNVGTPTSFFAFAIRECRLPSRLIAKLGLEFTGARRHRRYGRVPPPIRMYSADNGDDSSVAAEEWERHNSLHEDPHSARRQLHHAHDYDNQPGTKERLFEEEMEVTWDKGSSGLVFYTDAQYWRGQTTFEERNCDDWDVDMSVYCEKNGGDADARQMAEMTREHDLKDGKVVDSVFRKSIQKRKTMPSLNNRIDNKNVFSVVDGVKRSRTTSMFAANVDSFFVKSKLPVATTAVSPPSKLLAGRKAKYHNNLGCDRRYDYARMLMKRQGWERGQGLGREGRGIKEALIHNGQTDRTGLGYKKLPLNWSERKKNVR